MRGRREVRIVPPAIPPAEVATRPKAPSNVNRRPVKLPKMKRVRGTRVGGDPDDHEQ